MTNRGPGQATEVANHYASIESFNFTYWGDGSAIATLMVAGALLLSLLVTRMAPPIAFTILSFLGFTLLGLLDTISGLVMVYPTFNLAMVVRTMRSFFAAAPRSREEAAWIGGAGVWQAFLRVSLPLAAPGLAATGILCFILS